MVTTISAMTKKRVFKMKPGSHVQDLKLWKVSLACDIFQRSGPSCLIPAASNSHHFATEFFKTSRKCEDLLR